jgi:hypothetical protein
MRFQIKTLFNDPTPDGYIYARYVIPMLKIAQDHTAFSEAESDEFVRHMTLVAKKNAFYVASPRKVLSGRGCSC